MVPEPPWHTTALASAKHRRLGHERLDVDVVGHRREVGGVEAVAGGEQHPQVQAVDRLHRHAGARERERGAAHDGAEAQVDEGAVAPAEGGGERRDGRIDGFPAAKRARRPPGPSMPGVASRYGAAESLGATSLP